MSARVYSQHPLIQFIKEVGCNKKIPFLDVLVERTEVGVTTKVYKKKTHTDQYIHYTSHHHHRVKSGSMEGFVMTNPSRKN